MNAPHVVYVERCSAGWEASWWHYDAQRYYRRRHADKGRAAEVLARAVGVARYRVVDVTIGTQQPKGRTVVLRGVA